MVKCTSLPHQRGHGQGAKIISLYSAKHSLNVIDLVIGPKFSHTSRFPKFFYKTQHRGITPFDFITLTTDHYQTEIRLTAISYYIT